MSRQSRKRRHRHVRSGVGRFLSIGAGVLVAALIIGAIAAVGYVLNVAKEAPALSTLRPLLSGGTSQVFASDGTRLGFIQSDLLRSPVGWGEIPANLKNATVAIEDQRFYKHDGVDLTGIFRAAIKDVTHGAALQGGSTITMQLMRNVYLGGDQHTLKQKIIEAKLALDFEKAHSKQYILTSYLNSVPYGTVGGQTALGVQAAARILFDKPASQLSLEQAALLAGLPQAPSQYNPFRNPAAARERRNEVLAKMAELHYISPQRAAATERAPLELHLGHYYSERKEDFFFEYVHELLVHRYGKKTVEEGGLKVYTTIDLNMQRLARKAIAEVLYEPSDPAAALSRGVDPNSTYYISKTLPAGWLPGYPTYEVKTFEGTSENRAKNLVTATLNSDNTVYAQLAADLGESTITEMAHKMGVTSPLDNYAAEALGGLKLGVTPLEMADVYAMLADGGWRNTPIAISRVVFPDGHSDRSWGVPHRVKVLSDGVTSEETTILHENVLSGTAGKSAINCPTAAKTGTTNDLIDAWLDGYTPNYSTVVWMGYPTKRISMTSVHGVPQQGGYLPADIWHAYMAAVTEGKPCAEFPQPKEPITYQPFYGKYASTGLAQAGEETQETEHHKKKSHHGGGSPTAPEHGAGARNEAPTTAQPPAAK